MKLKLELKLPEIYSPDLRMLIGFIIVFIGISLFGLLVAGLAAFWLLVNPALVGFITAIFLLITCVFGGAYVGEKLFAPGRKDVKKKQKEGESA